MRVKKFLSLLAAISMLAAAIPALSLAAEAASDLVAAYDITDYEISGNDIALTNVGMTGKAVATTWWSGAGIWEDTASDGGNALMFYPYGGDGWGYGSSGTTKTATLDIAKYTTDASEIDISFVYGAQNLYTNNNGRTYGNYQEWSFVDNGGDTFAYMHTDIYSGDISFGVTAPTTVSDCTASELRGKTVAVKAYENTASWTVEYYIDGVLAATDTVSDINGIAEISSFMDMWNYTYAAMALIGLKVEVDAFSLPTAAIKYVDADGNEIAETEVYSYVDGTQYGYSNAVVFPNIKIPSIDGYVFRKKTVSESDGAYTVTLAYEKTTDSAFFAGNTDNDAPFISLNMLGAHDAFTSGMVKENYDAAGIAEGDQGSIGVASSLASMFGFGLGYSKAQSLDAYGLLEAGVRYFDVRLSRSDTGASNSYTSGFTISGKTDKHTNGVFYTTHGLIADEFSSIAYTIAQWAKEHPGEIIVLDFQEIWDNTNGGNGNSTEATWNDLNALLITTGIYDYVTIGNGDINSYTYGSLTENGAKSNIVLFGRYVATKNNVGSFILRGTGETAFEGKLYSNYDKSGTEIGSSYSANYINAQVDYLEQYDGDHPAKWMFRVMQAQSESNNLLSKASSDNTSLLGGLTSNKNWLSALPVIMVNGVGSNTDDIVALLRSLNTEKSVSVNLSCNGDVYSGSIPAYIGGLFTKAEGALVKKDGADIYYVSEEYSGTTYVPYDLDLSDLTVSVAKLDSNVFTIQNGGIYAGNLDDDGIYAGKSNFAAFNWGGSGTYDRIGVAVLDAALADSYTLTATRARYFGDPNASVYAVSYEDYLALTKLASLSDLLTPENLLSDDINENKDPASISLNADVFEAAMGDSGKIVILGNSYGGLYGLAGENMKIEISRTAPAVSAELGWDSDNSRFTIDFAALNTASLSFDKFSYGVDIACYGDNGAVEVGSGAITEDVPAVGIITENTNLPYAAQPWVMYNGEKTYGETAYAGIYGLLAENISNETLYTTKSRFDPIKTAEALEVVNAGGIFVDSDGSLTKALLLLLDKNTDGSLTLKEVPLAMGIRFRGNDGSPASDGKDLYDTITINSDKTVTLSSSSAEELSLETVELDEVELVFAAETVSEDFAENVNLTFDFEEIF